jgi:hemerythrin-like domain-containing protein
MKITEVLMAEHAVFHNLFDHIEAAVPRLKTLDEVRLMATLVDRVMAPHSKTEDDLFIEPLEHCFEQIGQNETFHAEHRQIEEKLAGIHKLKTLAPAKKTLLTAIAELRNHFDKEERIVFPLAERVLKPKTLSDLGTEWLLKREAKLRKSR